MSFSININSNYQSKSDINHEKYIADKYSLIAETFVNTNDLNPDDFLELVFKSLFSLIPEAQKGSFYKLENQIFKPLFSRGYDTELLSKLTFSIDDAFVDFESVDNQVIDAYEVFIKKRDDSRFNQDIIKTYKELGTYENFISLYAPIKYLDQKVGLICLENFDNLTFSNSSKLLLKIYAQLTSNYYTLKLQQEKENDKYNGIINALINAIEVKDSYTVGHAKRVSEYCERISIALKLSSNQISKIKTAAILHDVGKIGIPDGILNKTGPLTQEEINIVKMHSEHTKKILSSITEIDEIVNFAYLHHEHYDGSGYPLGLVGDNIPFEAQIIQCADAFDAMSSERAYRSSLNPDEIKNIFLAEKGKQFNPQIVDVIIDLFLTF